MTMLPNIFPGPHRRAGLPSSAGAEGLKGAAASERSGSQHWSDPGFGRGHPAPQGRFFLLPGPRFLNRAQPQEGNDLRRPGLWLWDSDQSVTQQQHRLGKLDPAQWFRSTEDPTEHSAGFAVTLLCCRWAEHGNLQCRGCWLPAVWDTWAHGWVVQWWSEKPTQLSHRLVLGSCRRSQWICHAPEQHHSCIQNQTWCTVTLQRYVGVHTPRASGIPCCWVCRVTWVCKMVSIDRANY